jgi:TPR repeat protein
MIGSSKHVGIWRTLGKSVVRMSLFAVASCFLGCANLGSLIFDSSIVHSAELGSCYGDGLCTSVGKRSLSPALAIKYWSKACAGIKPYTNACDYFGDSNYAASACTKAGDLFRRGDTVPPHTEPGQDIEKSEVKAIEFFEKGCRGGDPDGCERLGQSELAAKLRRAETADAAGQCYEASHQNTGPSFAEYMSALQGVGDAMIKAANASQSSGSGGGGSPGGGGGGAPYNPACGCPRGYPYYDRNTNTCYDTNSCSGPQHCTNGLCKCTWVTCR